VSPLRLRALLAIADHGSVAAAARSERTNRTVIRRRVAQLSEELGVPLIETQGFRTELTPAALSVLKPARELVRRSQELRGLFERSRRLIGHYRFAAPLGLPPVMMARARALMSRTLPDATLELVVCHDPVSLLGTEADFAFAYGPVLPEGPWRTTAVARIDERLIAAPEYLAKHGTPRTLDDLAQHRILVWRRPGASARTVPLRGGGAHRVNPWLVGNDAWLLHRCADDGEGIVLVSVGPLPDGAARSDMVHVLPDVVHRDCTLQVVVPTGAFSLPRLRTLWSAVRSLIAEI